MKLSDKTNALALSWAHRDAPKGVAGNVSFDGACFYSYKTIVAVIATRDIDAASPLRIVLSTYRRYSATTSAHIALARSAAREAGMWNVGVADVSHPLKHDVNMLGIARDIHERVQKAMRAKVYHEFHMSQARKRADEFNMYAQHFGLAERIRCKDSEDTDFLMETKHLVDTLNKRCERSYREGMSTV